MMEMRQLSDTNATTLYWIQPRWGKPQYELRSDDELFCTLQWGTYVAQDPASLVSADGQCTLKYQWPSTVRIISSDSDIAVCKRGWWLTDTVEFVDGRRFQWRLNFWRTGGVVSSQDIGKLLSYKLVRYAPFKLKIRVDLVQRVKDLPEAVLLAAVGLYLWFIVVDFSMGN